MANCKGKNCKSAEYRDGLSADEKQRYEAKLSIVGGLDPYEGKLAWSDNVNILPAVTYPDIVNYLLFTPSAYSADDLKAYKSLDAYNQFVSGWVREKSGIVHGQYVVVTAKVLHSQRMREKPLRPWVIVEKDGKIVAAHCNCMAGLGEACTHVAALLFSIEATVKIRDSKTVTQEKAYWLLPSDCKTISYKEVNEINFVSARTAKKKLDKQLDSVSSPAISETPSVRKTKSVPEASFSDFMAFAEKLSKLDSKPAILSLIEPYSDKYVPKFDVTDFPSVLTDLKNDKLIGASLKEILEACSSIQVHCSKQQAENVELHTQSQSKSKMWFKFRAGRITASKAKAICTMDKENPSQSLIKSICYPETNIFQSAATKWGLDQEKRARDVFVAEIGPMHDNIRIEDSGFIISTAYPAVGASPDGIFVCDCCGSAVVEIKCPYNIRKEEINADNCKYLTETEGNQLKLKKDHQYFYQIQTQLGVTNMEMAYFVVWTEKSCHIETIMFEESIWNEIISESNKTFRVAILPELVGKYFTTVPASVLKVKPAVENIDKQSVPSTCNSDINDSSEKLYCLCSQVEHGDMIACDNSECTIEWFHYRCVNIEKPPKGKWYCPNCRKLPEFKRRRIAK